jgi:hypothetical protein
MPAAPAPLIPRHLPYPRVFSYNRPYSFRKGGWIVVVVCVLLIGIPTAALVYDFFTGGEAATTLGRRNRC